MHVPGGAAILDEVSFSVRPGSLVAVVGPTGAGKTTLLNALTGRLAVDGGTVRIHGVNAVGSDGVVRRHVGYVPQDDPLHATLGLRRLLEYTAELRLGAVTDAAERARRVDAVLDELGLSEQASLPVACLSGGQRKRASVAVELISEPDVLILDEPTTGLDPGREKSVLAMLRSIADAGRTVISVTHSTHALAVCDVALFLAPGGRVAFFGPPAEAAAYFSHNDAADLFLELGRGSGQEWKDRFRADPAYDRHVVGDVESDGPAAVAQVTRSRRRRHLLTLARRNIDVIRGDKRLVRLLALEGPIVGLLLWAVLAPGGLRSVPASMPAPEAAQALGHAAAVAMFLVLGATWLGAATSVREIVKERRILLREKSSGLSLRSYVGSKVLVLGGLCIVQSLALTLIACSRQSVSGHGAALGVGIVEILVAVALSALAAVALGLVLSALVSSADKAMTLLPITLVAQLVLCGAWVKVTAPGLRQLGQLTSAHWGVEAITATVRGDAAGWWRAVVALTGITVASLVIVLALVERGARAMRLSRVRQAVRFSSPTLSLRVAGAAGVAFVTVAALGAHLLSGSAGHAVPKPTTLHVAAAAPVTTVPVTTPPTPVAPVAKAVTRRVITPAVAKSTAVTTPPVTTPVTAPPVTTPTTTPPVAAAAPAPVVPTSTQTAAAPTANPFMWWAKMFTG